MTTSDQATSSISKASSYEAMGEFWDTHSSADFWEQGHDVEFAIRIPRRVALAEEVYQELSAEARRQGVQAETLANLWLSDRLRVRPLPAPAANAEAGGHDHVEITGPPMNG